MTIFNNNRLLPFWENYRLDIIWAGDASVGVSWEAQDVCSSYSRVYYITQGEGIISFDGKTISLTEGKLYVIPAGLKYSYHCPNTMQQLFFHINVLHKSGMDLLQGHHIVYERHVEPKQLQRVKALYHSDKMTDAFRLKGILMEGIADFVEEYGIQEQYTNDYSKLVEEMFRIAQNPVDARNSVKTLADDLHVSVSTLSKRFRRETGMTPSTYLNQLVINRACYLLHTEEYSIARIAAELGFGDQFYFAKYFKRQMGVSPSIYRKQVRVG